VEVSCGEGEYCWLLCYQIVPTKRLDTPGLRFKEIICCNICFVYNVGVLFIIMLMLYIIVLAVDKSGTYHKS